MVLLLGLIVLEPNTSNNYNTILLQPNLCGCWTLLAIPNSLLRWLRGLLGILGSYQLLMNSSVRFQCKSQMSHYQQLQIDWFRYFMETKNSKLPIDPGIEKSKCSTLEEIVYPSAGKFGLDLVEPRESCFCVEYLRPLGGLSMAHFLRIEPLQTSSGAIGQEMRNQ